MNRAEFVTLYVKVAWSRIVADRGGVRVPMDELPLLTDKLRGAAITEWNKNRVHYTIHSRAEVERELRGKL